MCSRCFVLCMLEKLVSRMDAWCVCRKFFRDAIPMLGSASSVELIVDMVVKRQIVTGSEAEIWLTSQAFVARPTAEMMGQALQLLQAQGELKKKATLAVSSLVNNYCRVRADCENTKEVRNIINKLETALNQNCQVFCIQSCCILLHSSQNCQVTVHPIQTPG